MDKAKFAGIIRGKSKKEGSASQLLSSIENFIAESDSGKYVSWVNEHDYYGEEEDDYINFEEWTQPIYEAIVSKEKNNLGTLEPERCYMTITRINIRHSY
ncbi:MAG: hypothetical protein ABH952_11760 [Candidatus Omnitrophota bacterium]